MVITPIYRIFNVSTVPRLRTSCNVNTKIILSTFKKSCLLKQKQNNKHVHWRNTKLSKLIAYERGSLTNINCTITARTCKNLKGKAGEVFAGKLKS